MDRVAILLQQANHLSAHTKIFVEQLVSLYNTHGCPEKGPELTKYRASLSTLINGYAQEHGLDPDAVRLGAKAWLEAANDRRAR